MPAEQGRSHERRDEPGHHTQREQKRSGGGLEFSGVGAGAHNQTKSAPQAQAATTPTANVTTASSRSRRRLTG
jgi:hypothetical protein